MARKSSKEAPPQTTGQALGIVLKSARDIMRKDKGLNGDLDRLPLLTWIMFLKFSMTWKFSARRKRPLAAKNFVLLSMRLTGGATGQQARRALPATNCFLSSIRTNACGPMEKKGLGCSRIFAGLQARMVMTAWSAPLKLSQFEVESVA
jgi:hypothetical protein